MLVNHRNRHRLLRICQHHRALTPFLIAVESTKTDAKAAVRKSATGSSDNYCVLMWSEDNDQSGSLAPLGSPPALAAATGQSYLARLGILYSAQIRLAMVTELYMREMSPKQFYEEIGGSSYDSVRRHFLKLAEYGWLRKVRSERGRRGRPEHLYRSTELPVIDDETWAEIPVSIRDAFTAKLVDEMGDWVAKAITAGTFDSRPDSAITFATGMLDDAGWSDAIAVLNSCFRELSQEQTDAKVRLERAEASPILMIVELGGFEAAQSASDTFDGLPIASPELGAPSWPPRIAKVFSDPLSLAIISLLNRAPLSPTLLHAALGGDSVETFERRCRTLMRFGWVARVYPATGSLRRGATKNFYRATCPALDEGDLLGRVPKAAQAGAPWRQFQAFCDGAVSAIKAGTFNAQPERHLTMCRLSVDEMGWSQVIASVRSCERSLARVIHESSRRMKTNAGTRRKAVHFLTAGFATPSAELDVYRQLG